MKALTRMLSVLAVTAAASGAALAQDGIQLRYLPKAGELIYRKVTKLNQTQTVNNKDLKNTMNTTDVSVWTVGEADKKGNVEIKAEAKLMEVKMNFAALGDYTFDSRKNDNEKGSALGAALTPLYERLSNGSLTITITPLGKLTRLDGYKELIGDLLKDNPIAAQFAAGGSEEASLMTMAEFFARFSEKPVRPLDRWDAPFELNLDKFGSAKGKRTYVYDGEGKVGNVKTVKLSVTQELSFDLDIDMGGAKVTGKLSITESKGTLHFDPKKGCLVSMASEYKVSGNLNVAVNGMNIPIATEQAQSITMDLLDKLPK